MIPAQTPETFHNANAHVQSWYAVCPSNDIRRGTVRSKPWLDRRVAVFRGDDGQAQVVDAQCPHFGADLGQGCVMGNDLRCGFHHWTFDRKGRCKSGGIEGKASALMAYPTEEKYGMIWAFNGPTPLFALPSPPSTNWAFTVLPAHRMSCHPHLAAANGLDLQHFKTVHKVHLLTEPRLETPDAHSLHLHLTLSVAGKDVLSRLLRAAGVDRVALTFSTFGGNMATSHSKAGVFETFLLFANQPAEGGATESRAFLMAPRAPSLLGALGVHRLVLALIRPIIGRILKDDVRTLQNIRFRKNLTAADAPLSAFIDQVNRMPVFPETTKPSSELQPAQEWALS